MRSITVGRVHHLLAVVLVLSLLGAPLAGVAAAQPSSETPLLVANPSTAAADAAMAWLRTQQSVDGSFTPPSGSAVQATADLVTAAAALGRNILEWRSGAGQPTVLDYLANQAAGYAVGTNAGQSGRLLVALVAGNLDPRAFAGLDLVAETLAYHLGAGVFDTASANQAWAILGLVAAREPLPTGSLDALAALQQPDGGWQSSATVTALALQALAAGSYVDPDTVLSDGLAYLRAHQTTTGGFFATGAAGSKPAEAVTTAACIQALISLGENPLSAEWLASGTSAPDDLLNMQVASGAFATQFGSAANLTATIAALPALVGRPLPVAGARVAISAALGYLRSVQQADGSFQADLSNSTEGLLALAAADELPRTWRQADGVSLLDYLTNATGLIVDSGQAGRLVAALAMVDENPYLVGNVNLVERLWQYYDPTTGRFDKFGEGYNQMLALWGLTAVGEDLPPLAIEWLWDQQRANGGWAWGAAFDSDTNSTALALQTLLAAGVDPADPRVAHALGWLATQQFDDAGFSYDKGSPWTTGSDANSTALVIQALLAADAEALDGWEWTRTLTATESITMTVNRPIDRLIGFQLPNGALEWQQGFGANYVATVEAIPALAGRSFPWKHSRLPAARSALEWLKAQQQANGSFGTPDPLGATIQAVLAGVTLGDDVGAWSAQPGGTTALEYLASRAADVEDDAATLGYLITAIVAANENPRDLNGVDLLAALLALNDGTGQYGASATAQAWALLGLAAARCPISAQALQALRHMQMADGSWSGSSTIVHTESTALALQALAAVGEPADSPSLQAGLAYLRDSQTPTGGFAINAQATVSDTRATIAAIQAILALGDDPRAANWQVDGHSPLDELAASQLTGGAWERDPGQGADTLTTSLAIPALLLEVNPLCTRHAAIVISLPYVASD